MGDPPSSVRPFSYRSLIEINVKVFRRSFLIRQNNACHHHLDFGSGSRRFVGASASARSVRCTGWATGQLLWHPVDRAAEPSTQRLVNGWYRLLNLYPSIIMLILYNTSPRRICQDGQSQLAVWTHPWNARTNFLREAHQQTSAYKQHTYLPVLPFFFSFPFKDRWLAMAI